MNSFLTLNPLTSLEALQGSLYSGEALYMAGAGCSQSIGFPSWKGLIENLAEDLTEGNITTDNENNYLDVAQRIKNYLNQNGGLDKYHAYLHGKFKHPRSVTGLGQQSNWPDSDLHCKLFEFPIKAIVTTNYDHAIEYYLRETQKNIHVSTVLPENEGGIGDFLFSLKDKEIYNSVFHLHGDFENAKTIVLARDDYDRSYKKSIEVGGKKVYTDSLYKKTLWTLLTTRCLVFVGFSLTDEYLNEILKEVCSDVWGNFKGKHFAIVPHFEGQEELLSGKKKSFLEEFSIETIFFKYDESFEDLLNLLEWLKIDTPPKSLIEENSTSIENQEIKNLKHNMSKMNQQVITS